MNPSAPINKMGTEPVGHILMKMGIPIICSMVLQACYNIVDSMFVARIPDTGGIEHAGELAVNALTLAFPIQMLIVAFGIGSGVGVNALLARALGQKNREKLGRGAGNGIFLGIVIYACFVIFALVGIRPYLNSQTNDPIVLSMAAVYLQICLYLSFGMVLFCFFEKFLQATGKTVLSTIAQVAGALTNIVLDPILIYGLLGAPAMGIAGAAWATVIGQIVSFVLGAFFHFRYNQEIPFGLSYLKPSGSIIREIYAIGISAIVMQALMSVMTYGVNIIFGQVSASAVTAYGIFYKIQQFIFFAGFGVRDAMTPLISYNYGLGNPKRVRQGCRYGIFYTEILMVAGIILLELFAHPLAQIFGLTAGTEVLCVRAMRIIAVGFIFAGISIAGQGIFQALDSGNDSLIVSLLRLLIVVLPLCELFAKSSNPEFVIWFAFPIAEAVAAIFALFFIRRVSRKKIAPMDHWGKE